MHNAASQENAPAAKPKPQGARTRVAPVRSRYTITPRVKDTRQIAVAPTQGQAHARHDSTAAYSSARWASAHRDANADIAADDANVHRFKLMIRAKMQNFGFLWFPSLVVLVCSD